MLAKAEQYLIDQTAALQHAETVLARSDRPLHRCNHQSDIGNARHRVRILRCNIELAAAEVDTQARRIAVTRTTEAAAAAGRGAAPASEELGTIEDQLAMDLRVRTTIACLDQPNAIIGVLGRRPAPAQQPATWTTPPDYSPKTKPPSASPKESAPIPAGTGRNPSGHAPKGP